jgi:hypothetical protein
MPRIISYASFSKTTQHTINYLQYIDRQSPLFSPGGEADVKEAVRQARRDTGNLAWYQILSFPSEELQRLQADRNYFKAFLTAHKQEIAKAYNITPSALHCYASFHDKDYHPHLHLVFWSSVPGEGAVRVPKQASEVETKKLRAKALNEKSNVIKSLFANEMFRGDIEQLRVQKGEIRQAMNQQLEQQLQALANGKSTLPVGLVDELQKLGQEISVLPGKAQYGWLPSEIKGRVSDLLRQAVLETPELAELYAQSREAYYNIVKDTYVDSKITMAEKMKQWEQQFFAPAKGQDARKQNLLIETVCKLSSKEKMPFFAPSEMQQVELGELAPSSSKERMPQNGLDEPQQEGFNNAKRTSSTEKTHTETPVQLYNSGLNYLYGKTVAKDAPRALQFLEASAKQGNQFAQYSLGKLLLKGDRGVPRDREQGMYWMQKSAQQGNTFATAYLQYQSKSALATTCSMLYQLGKIIEADQRAQQNYTGLRHGRMKRKRRGHEYEQQPGIER